MTHQRLLVHTAAAVGIAASMALPASAHGLGFNFGANVDAQVRQEGIFDGADRGEWRRERGEDRRQKKLERQERKESRREQQEILRIDRNALLNAQGADAACVKAALEKRENAMLVAFDSLSATVRNALVSRKTALGVAFNAGVSAGDRETALKASWQAYGTSMKDANTKFRESQKNAFATWRADAKACLPTTTSTGN